MAAPNTISISVNGKNINVDSEFTILDLLKHLEVLQPAIAVERNGMICTQDQFEITPVKESDIFEIVSLVGGG